MLPRQMKFSGAKAIALANKKIIVIPAKAGIQRQRCPIKAFGHAEMNDWINNDVRWP